MVAYCQAGAPLTEYAVPRDEQYKLRDLPEFQRAAYDYLTRTRLATNSGIERRLFKRLVDDRSRARRKLRELTDNGRNLGAVNWHAAGDRLRLRYDGNGCPRVIVWCQSESLHACEQAVTSLMRRLANNG